MLPYLPWWYCAKLSLLCAGGLPLGGSGAPAMPLCTSSGLAMALALLPLGALLPALRL